MTKVYGCIDFICYVAEGDEEKKDQVLNNVLADLMLQFMDTAKAKGIKVVSGGYHPTGSLSNVCTDCKHYEERPEDWLND